MNNNTKDSFNKAVAILGLTMILFSIARAWTGPTANPPGNNASAPINVSSVAQAKLGEFYTSDKLGNPTFQAGKNKDDGTFTYGVSSAKDFCINNGGKCLSTAGGDKFGGMYVLGTNGTANDCTAVNPKTGGFSCPAGYTDYSMHESYYAWGACPNVQYYIHFCY